MFRLAVKMTLARAGRLVLTSLAVILGTAFLSGTFVFRDTINQTFDRLFSDIFRDVDAYVRSTSFVETGFSGEQRGPTPIAVLDIVLKVPGVAAATGDMQAFARVIGKDGKPLGSENGPPTFGGIASDTAAGLWRVDEGRFPIGASEVMLDRATADNGSFVIGDSVRVSAASGSRVFTLVGVANYGDIASPAGATFALFDQPTASEFLLRPGFVDSLLVVGDGSLGEEELATRIDSALPAELKLETLTGAEITAETQGQWRDVFGFFTNFLIAFSFIALGIGSFVIYNVFSISAAQRQRENALLRAVGAHRNQVRNAQLVEALAIGVTGSLLGFLFGIAISQGLARLLDAIGFEIPTLGISISRESFSTTFIVGVLTVVIAALLPARRAGRVPPVEALSASAIEAVAYGRKRIISAITLLVAAVAALVAAVNDAPFEVLGIGVLLLFGGVLTLGPVIARPVALSIGSLIVRPRGVTGSVARLNAARNPKRTSRTAAPVLIGVALVTAFTALASSVRTEIRSRIGDTFRGDIALSVDARGLGGIPWSVTDQIGGLPEVQDATGVSFTPLRVGDESRFVVVVNPRTIGGLFDLRISEGAAQDDLSARGLFVEQQKALEDGIKIGDQLPISTVDGQTITATVEGFFTTEAIFGNYVISRDFFAGITTAVFDSFVYVTKAEGVSLNDTLAAVAAVSSDIGIGTLQTRDEYIDSQSGQVNQLLSLIYALLGLSIIIAIVGIIITLLLSVFERRREIGLLRAVGMTKSQVGETVAWESVVTSLVGAVTGVVLGLGLGLVIVLTSGDELIGFTVPVGGTVAILVLSFVLGAVASFYPAWRATRVNVVEAIATS